MMSRHAEQPEFLQKLTDAQAAAKHRHSSKQHGSETLQESWWEMPAQAHVGPMKGGASAEALEADAATTNGEPFIQVCVFKATLHLRFFQHGTEPLERPH